MRPLLAPRDYAVATHMLICRHLVSAATREEDIQKMLAAQVHIGTRNSDSQMQDYIWRRRQVCMLWLGIHTNTRKRQGVRCLSTSAQTLSYSC